MVKEALLSHGQGEAYPEQTVRRAFQARSKEVRVGRPRRRLGHNRGTGTRQTRGENTCALQGCGVYSLNQQLRE